MLDRRDAKNVVDRVAARCRASAPGHPNRLNSSLDDAASPFIEQLLRFVDARGYSGAQTAAEEPFVQVDARPGRIVFEYNDDELLERDIYSLCGLRGEQDGQASQERATLPERAFQAGWGMHLQSGSLSFCFGQPIADVIVPVWDDPGDGSPDNKTRITLHQHREGSAPSTGQDSMDFFKQVQEPQPRHLLFLRQLRHMRISIRDEDGELVTANDFQLRSLKDDIVVVSGTSRTAEGTLTQERHYFVTRTAIPRTLSDPTEEHGFKSIMDESPEIVLAFPVDADFVPVKEPQETGADFPLSSFGFKVRVGSMRKNTIADWLQFLIHCDLVTEGATINASLLDGIATAFVDSIQLLCQHPELRFTWPRFLPLPGDVTDHPWSGLVEQIKIRIGQVPVLQTSGSGELRFIQQIRLSSPDDLTLDGTPLFGDAVLESNISHEYGEQDLTVLRGYGLQSTEAAEIVNLVQADLESPSSKLRSGMMSQDWHSRVARLLSRDLIQGNKDQSSVATQLDIIPLRDGTWCSAASGPIYWPNTQGVVIPRRFTARIVDDAAASNPERRLLFQCLGAQDAPVCGVRSQILNKTRASCQMKVAECSDELRFLYLTHGHRQAGEDWKHIVVVNQHLKPVRPSQEDVYLLGTSQYSPEKLFRSGDSCDGSDDEATGFPASFLHPDIVVSDVILPRLFHPTWRKWLVDSIGIREQPRLVSRAGNSVSDSFVYVAKHRQDVLLDVLEQLWRTEGNLVVSNPELLNQVKQVPVPCLSGSLHPLWETYLPLEDLQRRCLQFMEPREEFPFVDLGGQPSAEELANKWSFLYTHLGVSRNNDLGFLLDILSYVQLANLGGLSLQRCRDILRLYCELERRCADSTEPDSTREICR